MTESRTRAGGRRVAEPRWEPWSPSEVWDRLRGVTAPWYIAAGWALDLFRGEQTREHEDTEVGLPAAAFRCWRRSSERGLARCCGGFTQATSGWPVCSLQSL